MILGKFRTLGSTVAGCALFTLAFCVISAQSDGVNVSVTPHRIVLNSKCIGDKQDIQVIISMALPSGYQFEDITEFVAPLCFDGVPVDPFVSYRYCYIDANFLLSFNRQNIQDNPGIQALAGGTVDATIDGYFSATNANGEVYTRFFSGSDEVEILAPTKK